LKKLDTDRAATVVFSTPPEKSLDSNALAKWLGELRDRGTRELIFLCGDADGFPKLSRRPRAQKLFSQLHDFLHELARVHVPEQL